MDYSITFQMYCLLVFLAIVWFSLVVFSVCSQFSEAGTRSDWDVHQMHELLFQDRSANRYLNLRQRRVYSVSRCPFVRLMMCIVFFRYLLHFV